LKTILQTISGGFDSTYLLLKNIESGNEIHPLYVQSSCVHPLKQRIEYTAVSDLINELQKTNKNLCGLETVNININDIKGIYSTQPILWLLGLFTWVKNSYIKYDEVHLAYIMNDDAISLLSEIKQFWNSLFTFSDYYHNNIPKIQFPLKKYKKYSIIHELKFNYTGIVNNCWTCESPHAIYEKKSKNGDIGKVIEHCGECGPCRKLKEYVDLDKLTKYKCVENRNALSRLFKKKIKTMDLENHYSFIKAIPCEKLNETELTELKKKLNKQKGTCRTKYRQ
jgi:7-cyano-7-deazaguanine synthase in queuosine biosynthesis